MANGNQSGGMFATRDYMAEAQELMRQRDQQRLLQRATLTPQQQIGMLYGQAGQQLGNVIRQLSGYEDPIITAAKKQRDQEQAFSKTMVDFDAFAKEQNLMPGTASYDQALLGALQNFPQMRDRFRQIIMNPNYRLKQLNLEQARAEIKQREEEAENLRKALPPSDAQLSMDLPSEYDFVSKPDQSGRTDGVGLTIPSVESAGVDAAVEAEAKKVGLQLPQNVADLDVLSRNPTSIDQKYGKLLTLSELRDLPEQDRNIFNSEISNEDKLQMMQDFSDKAERSRSLKTEPAPMGLEDRFPDVEVTPGETISRPLTTQERLEIGIRNAYANNDFVTAKNLEAALKSQKDLEYKPNWQKVREGLFVDTNDPNGRTMSFPVEDKTTLDVLMVNNKPTAFRIKKVNGSFVGYVDENLQDVTYEQMVNSLPKKYSVDKKTGIAFDEDGRAYYPTKDGNFEFISPEKVQEISMQAAEAGAPRLFVNTEGKIEKDAPIAAKSTWKALEDKIINLGEQDAKMVNMVRRFDTDFLTFGGKLAGQYFAVLEKANPNFLTDEQRRYLASYTDFKRTVMGSLADYINEMSGAAVSEQEAARLSEAQPTLKDSPTQFTSKVKSILEDLKLAQARYQYFIFTGRLTIKQAQAKKIARGIVGSMSLGSWKSQQDKLSNKEQANKLGKQVFDKIKEFYPEISTERQRALATQYTSSILGVSVRLEAIE